MLKIQQPKQQSAYSCTNKMSFVNPSIYSDEDLSKYVDLALESDVPNIKNLDLYEVVVKAYWAEDIVGGEMIDIRAATNVESLLLDVDVIIMVSKEQTAKFDDRSMVGLIAAMLNRVTPTFRGRAAEPAIVIEKNFYELSPDIVSYFGKDLAHNEGFFVKVDNLDDGRAVYNELDRPRRSSFEEVLNER